MVTVSYWGRVVGRRGTEATLKLSVVTPPPSNGVLAVSWGNMAYFQRALVVDRVFLTLNLESLLRFLVWRKPDLLLSLAEVSSSLWNRFCAFPDPSPGWSRLSSWSPVCLRHMQETGWCEGRGLGFTPTPPAHFWWTQSLDENSVVIMKIVSKKIPYFPFPTGLPPWKTGFSERLRGVWESSWRESQAVGTRTDASASGAKGSRRCPASLCSAAQRFCKAHGRPAPEPQPACGRGFPSAVPLTLKTHHALL